MFMHQIDLSRVDLNLLVVFEALMLERHVGRAARRLSLSQSATSHALGRLRELFNDPLFVRHPRGVEPTVRGQELAVAIAEALAQLRAILQPPEEFAPATLKRTFKIAAHDYAMLVLIPELMADLKKQAPGMDFRCISVAPAEVIDKLYRSELDFALGGFFGMQAERIHRTVLFTDRFVGIARKKHPHLHCQNISLEKFVGAQHVLVSADGEARGTVDQALQERGLHRSIAITTPNFLAVPFIVEHTDIIGVLPERLATRFAQLASLTLFDLPIAVEPISCNMLVQEQLVNQPELRWISEQLSRIAT